MTTAGGAAAAAVKPSSSTTKRVPSLFQRFCSFVKQRTSKGRKIVSIPLHLQHELFLWFSLTVLAASSLQALYRRSFGLTGDFIYLGLASLWLGRHVIFRYVITSDTSTGVSPTLKGFAALCSTSLFFAGQYNDWINEAVVAKSLNRVVPQKDDLMDQSSLFWSPQLYYMYRWIRVRVLDPILSLFGIKQAHSSTKKSHEGRVRKSLEGRVRKFANTVRSYCPPIQVTIFVTVQSVLAACYFIRQYDDHPALRTYMLTLQSITPTTDQSEARGLYQPLQDPSWISVIFMITSGSTLLSCFIYRRVFLPIPDLVAGTNVLKAVRTEARGNTTGGKSHKTRVQRQENSNFLEFFKSIVTENRFRLACKVAILRIIDALVCCTRLPRTDYICKVTQHCVAKPSLNQLTQIFHPVGVTSRDRELGSYDSMFYTINPDRGSLIFCVLSVIVISSLLLLSQLMTLNKSYLAIMGHLAGEWKLAESDATADTRASRWDPGRRYKKGDLIVYRMWFSTSVYMATTNSPEGRPFDMFLRATHDLFRLELGHTSTSGVVARAAKLHCYFMATLVMVIIYYLVRGYGAGSLFTILFANIVACYGIVRPGLTNHDELERVAQELNAGE